MPTDSEWSGPPDYNNNGEQWWQPGPAAELSWAGGDADEMLVAVYPKGGSYHISPSVSKDGHIYHTHLEINNSSLKQAMEAAKKTIVDSFRLNGY